MNMSATKGLEGVVATQSSISSIINDQLTYCLYSIDDLTDNASFDEVIYLLCNRELPNEHQLNKFRTELIEEMHLPEALIQHLRSDDLTTVHPMAALRTAVSLLGLTDSEADEMNPEANLRKAVRIQAKISSFVTAFSIIRRGKDPVEPRNDICYAANFVYMLNGKEGEDVEVEAINKALVLHADHELNASTFTARVCVGTLS